METNKQFAKNNKRFIKACELAEVPAGGRQASKFRNEKGKAYSFRNQVVLEKPEDK